MEQLINNREWNVYPSDDLKSILRLREQIEELINFDIVKNSTEINNYKVTVFNINNEIISCDIGINCLSTIQNILHVKKMIPKEGEEEVFEEFERIKNKKRKTSA